MAKNLILAIDQGTTGTTVMLVDKSLKVIASKNFEFRQHYPKPGWVEHDLNDIWNTTIKAIKSVIGGGNNLTEQIAAIGITNQRETACFWSKKTGNPLGRVIVWQDRRTTDLCEKLKQEGQEATIISRTGLLLDPYFSATKVAWALQNDKRIQNAVAAGDCAFGTIDSYLLARLTGNAVHATEVSNASRTMLFNIHKLDWDDDLLELFKVPRSILPKVFESSAQFGFTKNVSGLPDGIPVCGMLGDQQAALLGQGCIEKGAAKCTYGTGSFILLNTGSEMKPSQHRLLTTIAWKINGVTTYALEGGAFTAGASVQWVRDGLQFIKKSPEIEALAKSVKDSGEVIFVPAFTGIGAPYWLPHARAAFFGITRGTKQGHLARAVLEGIALMNADILGAMEQDLGAELKFLSVDGGACTNNLLMQMQADFLNRKLFRPKIIETTVLGAVFAAGLGIGFWTDLSEIKKSWKKEKEFSPKMDNEARQNTLRRWHDAVKKA